MTHCLSHIWNPLLDSPGFTVPIFQIDKIYFTQDIEDGRIRGFSSLELESDIGLRRVQESIGVWVGDEEFVIFVTAD